MSGGYSVLRVVLLRYDGYSGGDEIERLLSVDGILGWALVGCIFEIQGSAQAVIMAHVMSRWVGDAELSEPLPLQPYTA